MFLDRPPAASSRSAAADLTHGARPRRHTSTPLTRSAPTTFPKAVVARRLVPLGVAALYDHVLVAAAAGRQRRPAAVVQAAFVEPSPPPQDYPRRSSSAARLVGPHRGGRVDAAAGRGAPHLALLVDLVRRRRPALCSGPLAARRLARSRGPVDAAAAHHLPRVAPSRPTRVGRLSARSSTLNVQPRRAIRGAAAAVAAVASTAAVAAARVAGAQVAAVAGGHCRSPLDQPPMSAAMRGACRR